MLLIVASLYVFVWFGIKTFSSQNVRGGGSPTALKTPASSIPGDPGKLGILTYRVGEQYCIVMYCVRDSIPFDHGWGFHVSIAFPDQDRGESAGILQALDRKLWGGTGECHPQKLCESFPVAPGSVRGLFPFELYVCSSFPVLLTGCV